MADHARASAGLADFLKFWCPALCGSVLRARKDHNTGGRASFGLAHMVWAEAWAHYNGDHRGVGSRRRRKMWQSFHHSSSQTLSDCQPSLEWGWSVVFNQTERGAHPVTSFDYHFMRSRRDHMSNALYAVQYIVVELGEFHMIVRPRSGEEFSSACYPRGLNFTTNARQAVRSIVQCAYCLQVKDGAYPYAMVWEFCRKVRH